jgi:hypothetical protein
MKLKGASASLDGRLLYLEGEKPGALTLINFGKI